MRATTGAVFPLMTILAAVAAVLAIVLLAVGQPGGAAAAAVLLLMLLAFGALDSLLARRQVGRHRGDPRASAADEHESVPALPTDDAAPVGATSEAHTDLDPHDLPPGHPAREEIERRSAALPGKTR